MSDPDRRGISEHHLQELAEVKAEVERAGPGRLTAHADAVEGHDILGHRREVYVGRVVAERADGTVEIHEGGSEASPADALRVALHNYRAAHSEAAGN